MAVALEPAADAVERILRARKNLLDFCSLTFPGYMRSPHLKLVAEHLEALERGDIDRLIIEMPPRH